MSTENLRRVPDDEDEWSHLSVAARDCTRTRGAHPEIPIVWG